MEKFVGLFAAGIREGSIAAFIALGIVLLHKATGVVNFAQGDLLTLGAYLAIFFHIDHGMPVVVGYVLTLVLAFGAGVFIERVGYAPLRKHPPLAVIISTFALALGLQSLIIIWFTADPKSLPSPVGRTASDVVRIGGAPVSYQTFLIVGILAVTFIGLVLLMNKTALGRQVRALAIDRETALLQGVRVSRLSMLMFGLSAMLAALGGILFAPTTGGVSPTMGFTLLLSSFAAVVLGGFDNIEGTVIASFGVAIAEQLLTGYLDPNYKEAYPFIILLGALMIKPEGIFRGATSVRY